MFLNLAGFLTMKRRSSIPVAHHDDTVIICGHPSIICLVVLIASNINPSQGSPLKSTHHQRGRDRAKIVREPPTNINLTIRKIKLSYINVFETHGFQLTKFVLVIFAEVSFSFVRSTPASLNVLKI